MLDRRFLEAAMEQPDTTLGRDNGVPMKAYKALCREALALLDQRANVMQERMFPVLGEGWSIPWIALQPYEAQAKINHSQTLAELALRGGLSSQEILAIIHGCLAWERIDADEPPRRYLETWVNQQAAIERDRWKVEAMKVQPEVDRLTAQVMSQASALNAARELDEQRGKRIDELTIEADGLRRSHVGLMNVSGALADAATIPVPTKPEEYGKAVRALTTERDDARRLLEECGQHAANACQVYKIDPIPESIPERIVAAFGTAARLIHELHTDRDVIAKAAAAWQEHHGAVTAQLEMLRHALERANSWAVCPSGVSAEVEAEWQADVKTIRAALDTATKAVEKDTFQIAKIICEKCLHVGPAFDDKGLPRGTACFDCILAALRA